MNEIVVVTIKSISLFVVFMAMYQLGEFVMKLIVFVIDAIKSLFSKIFKKHSPSEMWMDAVNSNWKDI